MKETVSDIPDILLLQKVVILHEKWMIAENSDNRHSNFHLLNADLE